MAVSLNVHVSSPDFKQWRWPLGSQLHLQTYTTEGQGVLGEMYDILLLFTPKTFLPFFTC